MSNKYLSRYSKYDTHFQRTDPWRHLPFDFETDMKPSQVIGEVIGTICFTLVMIGLMFLN